MKKPIQPVQINGLVFDALLTESVSFEAEAPEYPVETGYVVSDSIILRPVVLDMTLFLFDHPVTWKQYGGNGRMRQVMQELEDLYVSRQLCTVSTSDKVWRNMALLSFSLTQSPETGLAREIPLQFKEIRVTSSRKTAIPDSYGKSGATGATTGTASTNTSSVPVPSQPANSGTGTGGGSTPNNQSNASILYNLAGSAGLLPS